MMSMFMILHLRAYSTAVVKRRRILKIFGGLIEKYSLNSRLTLKSASARVTYCYIICS